MDLTVVPPKQEDSERLLQPGVDDFCAEDVAESSDPSEGVEGTEMNSSPRRCARLPARLWTVSPRKRRGSARRVVSIEEAPLSSGIRVAMCHKQAPLRGKRKLQARHYLKPSTATCGSTAAFRAVALLSAKTLRWGTPPSCGGFRTHLYRSERSKSSIPYNVFIKK